MAAVPDLEPNDPRGSGDPFWPFDLLPAQIAVVDQSGRIVATNRSWRDTAAAGCLGEGVNLDYLGECTAAAARGCDEAAAVAAGLRDVLAKRLARFVQVYPCAFGGRHHWFQAMITPASYFGVDGAIITHVDVTALQHDALTGLPNRALFEAQAEHVMECAAPVGGEVWIALIDLDGFKAVNDTHGHLAGDWLLCHVSQLLVQAIDRDALVARLGGDEFAVVLAPGADRHGANALRRSLAEALSCPIHYGGALLHIRASIGLACYPRDGTSLDAIVARADRRMYRAKRWGRQKLLLDR